MLIEKSDEFRETLEKDNPEPSLVGTGRCRD
jgi:hypothetical protein